MSLAPHAPFSTFAIARQYSLRLRPSTNPVGEEMLNVRITLIDRWIHRRSAGCAASCSSTYHGRTERPVPSQAIPVSVNINRSNAAVTMIVIRRRSNVYWPPIAKFYLRNVRASVIHCVIQV